MNERQSIVDFSEATLSPGELRIVALLTNRQLHEWEKRGMLPSAREGELGWRRTAGLEALALRVVSELHRRLGVPLVKLRGLLDWMLGNNPTDIDSIIMSLQAHALGRLGIPTPQALGQAAEILTDAPEGGKKPGARAGSKGLSPEGKQALLGYLMHRWPIVTPLVVMSRGEPVYLDTDLEASHGFWNSRDLEELVDVGRGDRPRIVVPVHPLINAARAARRLAPLPSGSPSGAGVTPGQREVRIRILKHLASRDFVWFRLVPLDERVTIEVRPDNSGKVLDLVKDTVREGRFRVCEMKLNSGRIPRVTGGEPLDGPSSEAPSAPPRGTRRGRSKVASNPGSPPSGPRRRSRKG